MGVRYQLHGGAVLAYADGAVRPIDLERAVRDCHCPGDPAALLRDGHLGALAGLRLRGHADIGGVVQITADGDALAVAGQIEVVVRLTLFVAGDLGAALDIHRAPELVVAVSGIRIDTAAVPHRGIAGDLAAIHGKLAVIAVAQVVIYIQIDTAAAAAGVVVGDLGASGQIDIAPGIAERLGAYAAAILTGPVSGHLSAGQGGRSGKYIDAAAASGGAVVGDLAAVHGEVIHDVHAAALAVVVVGDLAAMQIKRTVKASASLGAAGLHAAAVSGDLTAVHVHRAVVGRRAGAAAGDFAAVNGHIAVCGIGPDINTAAAAAPDHTVKDVSRAVNINGLILRRGNRPRLRRAVRQVQHAGGYLNGAAAVLCGDRVPVQAQRPRQHGHAVEHHVLRQVVIARGGQRIAACPGLERHVRVGRVIPDIPGAVRRMAADAVGVLAERPHDKVFAVRENGVGRRIVRKEAGRVGRAAAGQTDRAARRQLTLLFRRDADVGRAVQRPDGDGDPLRQEQVSVGVSGDPHVAGNVHRTAVFNALTASGDGAAVHGQRPVVDHAGAGGGDGAAVHGECTLIFNTDTISGGNGAAGDGQRTAVFNFAGKCAVLQRKAAALIYGHIAGKGAAAAVGQREAAACHGHISGDAVSVHAEGHIIAQRLPGGERHVPGQVVHAGGIRQRIGLLPRGQLLPSVQMGDQAIIAAALAVVIDPAVGGVRHGEPVGIGAILVAGEVLPPDAVRLRLFPVELVGHLAGGEGRLVCDGRTGNGCLAVILQIVAVFHRAAVGSDDGRGGGEVASWPAGCTLEPAGDIAVLDQTVVDKGDAAHQIFAALAQRQCAGTAVLDNALTFVVIDDAADVLLTGPVQRLAALDGAVVGVRDGAGRSGYVHAPVIDLDGQILHGAAAGDAAEERVVLSSAAYPKGDRMAVSVKDAGVALDRFPRIVLIA